MKRLLWVLVVAGLLLGGSIPRAVVAQEPCELDPVLTRPALRVASIMGDCIEGVTPREDGTVQQRTTGGVFIWRPGDEEVRFATREETYIWQANGVLEIFTNRVPVERPEAFDLYFMPKGPFIQAQRRPDAPDFTFDTVSGETLQLSALRGRPVVLVFWASWCHFCHEALPRFEQSWETYGPEDVAFVGVNINDEEPAARAYIEETGLSFPNIIDLHNQIRNQYWVRGTPTTVYVDPDGRVARIISGTLGAGRDEAMIADTLARLAGSG